MENPTRYFLSTALMLCTYISTYAQRVDSILSLNTGNASITIPHPGSSSPPQELTIAFWLKSSTESVSNRSEVILSKRKYPGLENFSDLGNWQIFDATNASGQNDVRGFVGAAFDGRYVYCSPWWKGPTQSGKVLRYDTKVPYGESSGWTVYNAENEDGFQNLRGLEGNIFDGRYVYFVPLHHDGEYFAHVLRYDTHGDFSHPDSWEVFDAGQIDPSGIMKGFVGSVFDGVNIYFVPNPFAPHSRVLKYNTTKSFNDPAAWTYFDLWNIPTYMANNGFFGGIFDGRYVYFVPFNGQGTVVRLDTSRDFLSEDSWSTIDFNYILGGLVHGTYAGAAFDGKYIYFSPLTGGSVVRFDTSEDFFDPSSWQVTKILNLDGTYDVQGGVGPTYDGRYVYFPPMAAAEGRSGKFVAYDTHKDFSDLSSWRHIDLSGNDSNLKGFEGAVYDGQYVYFLPMNFNEPHGKIPRYKTYPDGDLSFEVQFSGSSSSFGSIPGKLSFSVGTTAGTRSTFLQGSAENLLDDQWHHVAVTYDGNTVNLFVDGLLKSQNTFDESASLIWNDANMIIGNSEGSLTNGYRGLLNDLTMWQNAFDEMQIQQLIKDGPSLTDSNLIGYWSFDTGMQSGKVEDASANANHSLDVRQIRFVPAVFAAGNTVCQSGPSIVLQTNYPTGGTWSGNGVDPSGSFSPGLAGSGTHSITYESTSTFGNVTKTFSAATEITVSASQFERPVIEQPDFYTLATNTVAPGYEWTKNDTLMAETTRSLQIKGPGAYKVRVSDDGECFTDFSEQFTVLEWSSPVISRIGFETLRAEGSGQSFMWYRNDTLVNENSGSLRISASATYTVKAVDGFGNVSPLSAAYQATFPVVPEVEQTDFHKIATSVTASVYEWYRNDSLLHDNSSEINALRTGYYKVRVIDSLGAASSFSEPFYNEDNWIYQSNEGEDEYQLDMSAGDNLEICPIDTTYKMTGFYPSGGIWSGAGISAEGVFSSSRELAGSTQIFTYSATRTFRDITKTYSASKEIYIEKTPSISSTMDILCNKQEAMLTADGNLISYLWSTGDTTRSIVITAPGQYFVQGKSETSCAITSEPYLMRGEYLPPPQILSTGLFELQATLGTVEVQPVSYVWMRNDSLLKESSPVVHSDETGHYKAKAISQSGCESDFSEVFLHEALVRVDQKVLMYPNPAQNYFNVAVGEAHEFVTITMTSPRGRQVYHETFHLNGEQTVLTIDLSPFRQTFYVVSIETVSGKQIKKLVVKTSY